MTTQQPILYTGNAWNVRSAQDLEAVGFDIIGTSSAAIANSFGFADGEKISFELLFKVVKHIAAQVSIPVSVDIERGYASTLTNLCRNVEKLLQVGCKGINLEDNDPCGQTSLVAPEQFAEKIYALKKEFGDALYINSRTDTYLQNVPERLAATTDRITIYAEAGTDGVFIPGLIDLEEVARITTASPVPVNLMALPGLAKIDRLVELGVKRISFGNFGYEKCYATHQALMTRIYQHGDIAKLF